MSKVHNTHGVKEHLAIDSDYLRTRYLESKPKEKRDVLLGKKLYKIDRQMWSSRPGHVDQYELSSLPRESIEAYQEARGTIIQHNNKLAKWGIAASLSGAGVAMLASFLTGGGWLYLGIALGVSGVGAIARRILEKKAKDPDDIATLEKVLPEVGKQLRKLDREGVSRPHYTDYAELKQLTPKELAKYEKAAKEILGHNKKMTWFSKACSWVANAASYAGLVLPMIANLPSAVVQGVMMGGLFLGTWLSQKFLKRVVPVKTEKVEEQESTQPKQQPVKQPARVRTWAENTPW